jgi:hypothetical protein
MGSNPSLSAKRIDFVEIFRSFESLPTGLPTVQPTALWQCPTQWLRHGMVPVGVAVLPGTPSDLPWATDPPWQTSVGDRNPWSYRTVAFS